MGQYISNAKVLHQNSFGMSPLQSMFYVHVNYSFQAIDTFLKFPHTVQQVLSGENTPLLAGVIPVFEVFLTGWEKLKEKRCHLEPFI